MPSPRESFLEHVENAAAAVQREEHLRDEAQVHVGSSQRRVRRDEAGVAAHELHQADPIQHAARFGVGRTNGPGRRLDRGGESEASFHPVQVVVDRLRDADHSQGQMTAPGLGRDGVRPP